MAIDRRRSLANDDLIAAALVDWCVAVAAGVGGAAGQGRRGEGRRRRRRRDEQQQRTTPPYQPMPQLALPASARLRYVLTI